MKLADISAALILSLGLLCPGVASAVTITAIDGNWTASDPVVSGLGTDQINWGQPAGSGQSGYSFTSAAVPLDLVSGVGFYLGTFTHLNNPIRGTLLRSAELSVSIAVQGLPQTITSVFNFAHYETHNEASVCANGGANYTGINVSGCADRVTATLNLGRSDTFTINGVSYVMDISGFEYNGSQLQSFWTQENKDNPAQLVGILRTVDVEPPSPVPLPASGVLFLSALAGAAYAGKRKSRARRKD